MTGSRRCFLHAAGVAASYGRILGANGRIRLGAIGVGGRGSYLVELARKLQGVEIVAFADVYQPRLAEARRKLAPDAREYTNYLALLDQKDVDAVIVGAPDHWHARMTMDAVNAGKDVYVEKPLTHAPEEGAPLEQAVRASGRVVQVGYQQRSWPLFLQAREVFASGVLGKLALVLVSWNQNYAALDEKAVAVDASLLDWKAFL
ncbi:MAG TPA: Gfo/Idh/MocA family oxidoreductase, partial [Bryobacteraceae bacterium]